MPTKDAIQNILIETGMAISAIGKLKTPDQAVVFFRKMGYEIPSASFSAALPNLSNQVNELFNAVSQLSISADDSGVSLNMANLFGRFINTIKAIGDFNAQIQVSGGGAIPGIADLPSRLIDFLIAERLKKSNPDFFEFMKLIGIIELNGIPDPGQPNLKIKWNGFATLLSSPKDLFNATYQWNTDFDFSFFIGQLENLMRSMDMPGGTYIQPTATKVLLGNVSTDLQELRFPLFEKGLTPTTYSQFGITISPAEAQPGKSAGFALLPYLMGSSGFQFDVCDRGELLFNSTADIKGVGIVIRPPLVAEGLLNMNAAFRASVVIHEKPDKAEEMILIGSKGGSRLSIQGLGMQAFMQNAGGKIDLGVEGELQALRLVIGGGDGDGFLQKILSGLNIKAEAAMAFGFSLLGGFYFRGGARLALDFALHIDLGPLNISGMQLSLEPAGDHFTIGAGTTLKFSLGPINAIAENIGIQAKLLFKQGNLGPADLSIGFKPPNGVGLSIDAGLVKGGGFLAFDFDREEYAGVFELSIAAIVTVKAIALITTKMPDGSKGFSLLIILTAEFGTGIQLGFGFTLLGVGGLLGLNRAMLLEPIAAGIRNGGINSIMFPADPVANAPRIINDLRSYFPPYEGKFLIGPMAKLGWGTPTIVSLALGVIVEIPGNIAIVGVLKIVLPEEHVPLIMINVGFIGALEFDKSRIWFFAAMYDSRILFMTMEGQMGLLMDYSDHPDFVLSVGGFHPQFNPPPLPFPNPSRIHIDVLRNPLQRITVENYFAVTSNTVQFGARAELFYGIDAFNIHGNFSFDALFQFSPFHFIIEISFSIGMDVFGAGVFSVTLKLLLQGPAPWQARGTATLSIDLWLFSIDISVDFDITWGEADNPKLPAIPAIPLLAAEINKPDNWRAAIPPNANLLVSVRKLDGAAENLVLHPVGTLQISQRIIPLHIQVDKVGNNPVSDAHRFALEIRAGAAGLVVTGKTPQEKFGIAQFQDLSDAGKLSRPSFQDFDSGLELAAGADLGAGKIAKRVIRYEVKIMDGDDKYHAFRWFKTIGTLFYHWLEGAAVANSALSEKRKRAMVPTKGNELIKVKQPGYVVAGVENNKAHGGTTVFPSEAHAREYLKTEILNNPAMAENLHVIPSFESVS